MRLPVISEALLPHILTHAALSGHGAEWGWAMRSVLLALSAPAALSLLGVAWPLLHAASYELHARAFQRTAVLVGVLARLVVAVLSPPWSQQAGFVKRSFIFDAFVLVIHQVRWGGEVQRLRRRGVLSG